MRQFKSLFVLAACVSFAGASAVERWTTSSLDTTTSHRNTNSSSGKVAVGVTSTGPSGIGIGVSATGSSAIGVKSQGTLIGFKSEGSNYGFWTDDAYQGVITHGSTTIPAGRGVVATGYTGIDAYGTNAGGYGVAGYNVNGTAVRGLGGVKGVVGTGGSVGVEGTSTNGYGVTATSTYGVALVASGDYLGMDVSTTNLYGSGLNVVPGGRGTGLYTYNGQYGVYAAASSWDGYDNPRGVVGDGYGGEVSYGVVGYAGGASTNENWSGWFAGDVYVGGTFDNPSDQKFKTNVRDYRGGLDKILGLKIKSYDMKVSEFKDRIHLPSGPQIGVIAQEAEKVFPELVHNATAPARLTAEERKKGVQKKGEEFKSVNYTALIPVLVQAIQELQAEVDALKAGR